jgi:hypothetical protein
MPVFQGHLGAGVPKDNTDYTPRIDPWGALGTSSMNGFFAEQVARGNGYSFTTALAGNALVAATTSNAPAIWNPPDSGRVLLLQCAKYGRTAKGTPLEGSIVYNYLQNVRSGPGTGADIVSGTIVAAINLRSDLADNSKVQFYPTTISTTRTPGLLGASGVAQTADNGATTVSGPHTDCGVVDWIWGMIQLWPGTLISLGASVSISTTYTISLLGLSLPKPDLA